MDRIFDSDRLGQAAGAAGCDGGTAKVTVGGTGATPLLEIGGVRDGRCVEDCHERDAVDRIPGGNGATAGTGRCPEVNDYG
jgi:hypothetical protein